MTTMLILVTSLLLGIVLASTADRAAQHLSFFGRESASIQATCHMTPAYPPPPERKLMEFVIDLDAPPESRWNEPLTYFMPQVKNLLTMLFQSPVVEQLVDMIQKESPMILARFPADYGQEISGIAKLLDVEVAEVILFNIAYELFGLCTSVVAQDTTGHVYHARNLDFGLWPSVNWTDWQWTLTEDLRDTLFMANFTKDSKVLYRSVVFGGYVGLLTGMKGGAFSLSVDSRFDDNYDKYLIEWLTHPADTDQFLAFTTRTAMETLDTYADACAYLMDTSLIGPSYVIMGGVNKNEGSVITFGPEKTLVNQWPIMQGLPANNTAQPPFYVLETNYDHWEEPPFFDDRRYPAEMCIDEIGSKGMGWYSLYNVLNALPNRNRLTTYTCLMDTATGDFIAYKQYCYEKECIPW